MSEQELAQRNKILEINTGSTLYGTRTKTSNSDKIGVFIADWDYYVGLKTVKIVDSSKQIKDNQGKNLADSEDCSYYELRKYIELAMAGNPNILETLFVDDKNITHITPIGRKLLDNRQLFISQRIKSRYLGYAYSQRHKMVIRADKFHELNYANNYLLALVNDRNNKYKYISELKNMPLSFPGWEGILHRIGNLQVQCATTINSTIRLLRNEIDKVGNRKELILKYGMDSKFASHLVRLLSECRDLLITGVLEFPLADADILIDIKNGKWTIKEVLDCATQLELEIESLSKDYAPHIPKTPDYDALNKLCMDLIKMFLDMKGPN